MPKCSRQADQSKVKPYDRSKDRSIIKVDKHWDDEAARFSLISYDNVRFYFPLWKLRNECEALQRLLSEDPEQVPHREYRFTDEHATSGAVNQLLYAIEDEYDDVEWAKVRGKLYQDLIDLYRLSTDLQCSCGKQSVLRFIRRELADSTEQNFADSVYIFIVACQLDLPEIAADVVRQDRLPPTSRAGAKRGYWTGIEYSWGIVKGQGGLFYDAFTPEMMQLLSQPYRLGLAAAAEQNDKDDAARAFLRAVKGE